MSTGRNATHYNMNHKNRGMALIFNHEDFHPKTLLRKRTGTNYDADSLANILNDLGFDVTVHRDLEYERLMQYVANAATFDHTDYDCFVMVVLTHGGKESILYSSDKSYKFHNLWKPFSANLCTSLAGTSFLELKSKFRCTQFVNFQENPKSSLFKRVVATSICRQLF